MKRTEGETMKFVVVHMNYELLRISDAIIIEISHWNQKPTNNVNGNFDIAELKLK